MKKQILAALAVISVLANVAYCTRYSGGTGEPGNPYLISTANDLNDIANHPNDFDRHFILVNDINLADYTGTQFNIIGNDVNAFTGVFDGNGHTISNFTYTSNDVNYIGLFGYVDDPNAEIKDLGLIDPNIDAGTRSWVGGLVGSLEGGISDCYVDGGSISGGYVIGGLVGEDGYKAQISNCHSVCQVSGDGFVGGLIGNNYGGTVSDCYSTGIVTGTSHVGGLVGNIWDGTISDSYSSATVTGGNYTGGLVGFADAKLGVTIRECYATGSVTATGEEIGGLVGTTHDLVYVNNSYALGSVIGDNYVGGLVGCLFGAVVVNCYSAGVVSGDSNVGGFVGRDDSGSYGVYTGCFWDRNINPDVNGIGNTTDPNVIGETTANMQRRNTFTDAGWDFVGETANGPNDIWTIRENRDYPRLWWQQLYMPGERSIIKNGSFEADGPIGDIDVKTPKYWCDVSLPEDKFYGYVDDDWGTQGPDSGNYRSLTIYSYEYGTFNVNDMATVSTKVYFEEDVNELIFDVQLATGWDDPWDPAKRTAFVLIDGNTIWESNSVGSDVRGEYLDQSYTVGSQYKDSNTHTLTLGLRANVSGTPYIEYYAQWDFIKFDKYCGGLGYLSGDFDLDCYVDTNDFKQLIDRWLVEEPGERYDLLPDGIIDFYDFSLFAGYWLANTDWQNWGDSSCCQVGLLRCDIDDSGEVDYGDMLVLIDSWLETGGCVKADLNFDEIVDFKDIAVLTRGWQDRSWLYWVQ